MVALTMLVAGLLLAVTYNQAAASAQGRERVRSALIEDIQRDSDVTDELAAQLETLQSEVTRTRDELLAASAVGQRALDDLAGAEHGAAAVTVKGPGLSTGAKVGIGVGVGVIVCVGIAAIVINHEVHKPWTF